MSNQKISWTLERRGLASLIPYEKNPRIIKGKKLDDLKESIGKFGLAEPIIINTDGVIIGGHARYYVLRSQGDTQVVDCYVPSRTLDEQEFKELNIRLNKNVAGDWDFEGLANWFEMDDLKSWGFEDFEFGSFSAGKESSQGKLDKVDEASGGEGKIYTCPKCNHTWTPEKKS